MLKKICVLLIATLLFAACGGKGEDRLQFMMWGDAEERAAVDRFLAEFVKKYPKIGAPGVIHLGAFAYWDKFQVLKSSEKLPDVFYMGAEELKSHKDQLLDLTDLIKRDAREMDIDDFYKVPFNAFAVDGRQYGIPKDFTTLVLYYNVDLFKKYGVALPDDNWTWDDLRNAAIQLTVRRGNSVSVYGFQVETWASWLPAFVWANGGEYMDKANKRWLLGKPPYLRRNAEAYQFLSDMMNKHKIAPDLMTKKGMGGEGAFAAGRVAMCAYGRWAVLRFKKITRFKWRVAELPRAPRTGKRASTLFATAYAIYKKSQKKADAWTLLKYLTSVRGQKGVAKSGLAIPARRSVAMSADFLKSEEVNKNQTKLGNEIDHTVYLRALEYARIPPQHENWLKVRERLDQWFQVVFVGKETALFRMTQKQDAFERIINTK